MLVTFGTARVLCGRSKQHGKQIADASVRTDVRTLASPYFFTNMSMTHVSLRRRRILLQEGSVINNYRILLPVLQPLGLYYMNSFATFDNGGFAFISPAKVTESLCAPPSPIHAPPQWSCEASVCAWIFAIRTSYHSVPSIISIRSAGPDCGSLACVPLKSASLKLATSQRM
jgi:hypothetical protein